MIQRLETPRSGTRPCVYRGTNYTRKKFHRILHLIAEQTHHEDIFQFQSGGISVDIINFFKFSIGILQGFRFTGGENFGISHKKSKSSCQLCWYCRAACDQIKSCRFNAVFYVFCIPDINECLHKNGNCSQICINWNGGFKCSCSAGYRLNADGRTCYGEFLNTI